MKLSTCLQIVHCPEVKVTLDLFPDTAAMIDTLLQQPVFRHTKGVGYFTAILLGEKFVISIRCADLEGLHPF